MFELGRVWKSSGLDAITAVAPCPGKSPQNPVERDWAIVTKIMGPRSLPKDNTAPSILKKWLDGEEWADFPIWAAIAGPVDFEEKPAEADEPTAAKKPVLLDDDPDGSDGEVAADLSVGSPVVVPKPKRQRKKPSTKKCAHCEEQQAQPESSVCKTCANLCLECGERPADESRLCGPCRRKYRSEAMQEEPSSASDSEEEESGSEEEESKSSSSSPSVSSVSSPSSSSDSLLDDD